MDTNPTAARFRTTSWTLILRARESPGDLEELLRRYWSPVYAYLRRSGHSTADAEDLTQGFLAEVVLRRDLIGRADAERGRFRSYLLTALKRFVIDVKRGERRGPEGHSPVSLEGNPSLVAHAEPDAADDPDRAYDRQWAAASLDEAVRRTEASCRADGMDRHWRAFEARVLQPKLHGGDAVPIDAVMAELGMAKEQTVYDMIRTVKRKVSSALRDVVAETVDDPSEIEAELAALRSFLAGG